MTQRRFKTFLIVEVFVIFLLTSLFFILPARTAGAIGGFLFLSLAGWILKTLFNSGEPTRWATFWSAWIYLLGAVLPIVLVRAFNWGVEFKNLSVLSIPGPQFHSVSAALYLVLMVSTAADWLRVRAKK